MIDRDLLLELLMRTAMRIIRSGLARITGTPADFTILQCCEAKADYFSNFQNPLLATF